MRALFSVYAIVGTTADVAGSVSIFLVFILKKEKKEKISISFTPRQDRHTRAFESSVI